MFLSRNALSISLLSLLRTYNVEKEKLLTTGESYRILAGKLGISEWDLSLTYAGGGNKWETHVRFAKQRLIDKGLARIVKPGYWEITEKGMEYINDDVED